jgi:hypothetical protein
MSYVEALDWATYVRMRGTLNFGTRMEFGFAMLAVMMNRALGGHAEMTEFMPYLHGADEEERDATIDEVMTILIQAKR